jgi:hypothetical protein
MLTLSIMLVSSTQALAQSPEQIGWFVTDLRGSISPSGQNATLATNKGFDTATIPATTFGGEAGAHVYVYRWRVITFGIGASVHTSLSDRQAQKTDLDPNGPTLRKRFTVVAPQLSFNFGGRDGWSYLSGGLGSSNLSLFKLDSGKPNNQNSKTVNYGGGARWFVNDHVAFSLDLRFYAISPLEPTDTEPGLPPMTIMVFNIGASFR